jgi:SAM-dependent methyltransferase
VDKIPVMLVAGIHQTMDLVSASLHCAEHPEEGSLYLDTLGISATEKAELEKLAADNPGQVDPVASFLVGATNGIAYANQIGRLQAYPIPQLRLEDGGGKVFLDLGCNWGRWSLAAGRKGYRAVGLDPSLGAIMAASRVARQLGVDADFVVGDARFLPFRQGCVDQVFSYSMLQHLDKADAGKVAGEIGRTLKPGGANLLQFPTRYGIRCLYHQARRKFREPAGFEVRYWTIPELRRCLGKAIGQSRFTVDCYFGIGLQYSDMKFMSPLLKCIVLCSEILRRLSLLITPLVYLADSVYVHSRKPASTEGESG